MKIFEKITRKDLTYFLIILIIILIAVSSSFLGNNKEANNNINFAATIVSIILGVIAILYTLMDSTGQKESIATLLNVSSKLEEQTKVFEQSLDKNIELSAQIESIKDEIQKNNSDILNSINSLNTMIEDGQITDVKQELENLKDKLNNNYGTYTLPKLNTFDFDSDKDLSRVRIGDGKVQI